MAWQWTASEEQAFEDLKEALTTAPVLAIPDQSKPFEIRWEVYTDASGFALGGVLLQEGNNGLQPVAYESRKMTPAEKNYPVHEQELLAIVHALKTWRCYLEGAKFKVNTDHQSLRYLFTQPNLSGRQARWMEFLQQYDFDIAYKKGEDNQADGLSRRPDHINHIIAMRSEALQVDEDLLKTIKEGYTNDDMFRNPATLRAFEQRGELWYFKEDNEAKRIVVPNDATLRARLIKEHHAPAYEGHFSVEKTMERLQRTFWWSAMKKSVTAYIRGCEECCTSKPTTQLPQGLLQPLPIPDEPWESVSMDLVTDLPTSASGNDTIVVFVDRLTKMVHFAPTTKTVTAPLLARIFVDTDHLQAPRDAQDHRL